MKHPRHVCGKAHTLCIIIVRLLCFRQKVTIVTYQILKMVLEKIQQDTPKTLIQNQDFLVSFSPVYLSQFLFSLSNSSSDFTSFPQVSLPGCLPTSSQGINLLTRIVSLEVLCAHFSIAHMQRGSFSFLLYFCM